MGNYAVQETVGGRLSNLYPSFYQESQVKNWTSVDIVVTERNGNQEYLPPAATSIQDAEATVQIESRRHVGARAVPNKLGTGLTDIQLKGKQVTIPLSSFRMAPIRIPEFDLIISTADQSALAKEMARENINPILFETKVDKELLDPRFVLQINDPARLHDIIFVNVFGMTVMLRAGSYGEVIPTQNTPDPSLEKGSLLCYLRYPYDYVENTKPLSVVFEISLEALENKLPVKLPSGDVVCMAETLEELKLVMAKKTTGSYSQTDLVASKMIPKDVHEAAVKQLKEEIERIKREDKIKLDTQIVESDNKYAQIQAKLIQATTERDSAITRANQWEEIVKARTSVDTKDATVTTEREKARKESAEASQKELERAWLCVKIGATAAAAVLSFTITMIAKLTPQKKSSK